VKLAAPVATVPVPRVVLPSLNVTVPVAVAGTADHIARFWDPRMRALIVAHLETGGAGLDAIAKAAVEQLAAKARAKAG